MNDGTTWVADVAAVEEAEIGYREELRRGQLRGCRSQELVEMDFELRIGLELANQLDEAGNQPGVDGGAN